MKIMSFFNRFVEKKQQRFKIVLKLCTGYTLGPGTDCFLIF